MQVWVHTGVGDDQHSLETSRTSGALSLFVPFSFVPEEIEVWVEKKCDCVRFKVELELLVSPGLTWSHLVHESGRPRRHFDRYSSPPHIWASWLDGDGFLWDKDARWSSDFLFNSLKYNKSIYFPSSPAAAVVLSALTDSAAWRNGFNGSSIIEVYNRAQGSQTIPEWWSRSH